MTDNKLLLSEQATIPTPRTGVIVVALGDGPPVAFKDGRGPTISERLFGRFKVYVEVDVSDKSFVASTRLPSASSTMFFEGQAQVRYRVANPGRLVERAIRDGRDTIWALLEPALQKATRGCAGADVAGAERQAQVAADAFRSDIRQQDLGIEIATIAVSATLDATTAQLVADVERKQLREEQIRAEQGLDKVRREGKIEILEGGARAMLAEVMVRDPNNFSNVLRDMAAADREKNEKEIALLQHLIETGRLEDHEWQDVKEEFARRVLMRAGWGERIQLGTAAGVQQIEDRTASPEQSENSAEH